MNDRCRTGVLDLIGAGVLIHTARASGTATPNTAILGVCSATPAAVWPAHWTIEQSHWNEAERGSRWGKLHYFNAKQYKMNLLLYIISYFHLLHTKDVTHTHTQKHTVLTIQILSAVDVEVVFPPHIDHGCIFLQQGRIGILHQEQQCQLNQRKCYLWYLKWVDVMHTHVQSGDSMHQIIWLSEQMKNIHRNTQKHNQETSVHRFFLILHASGLLVFSVTFFCHDLQSLWMFIPSD